MENYGVEVFFKTIEIKMKAVRNKNEMLNSVVVLTKHAD